MNYTLNQLQIFLKVTQLRSITKAAVELNLTQPAVSIQLKNFQDQFGSPLVEVLGKKVYVTDFGAEVSERIEQILTQVQSISNLNKEQSKRLTGKLRIAVVSTGKYVMPYFLSGFLTENKEVTLLMDVNNRAGVIQSLENNEIDLALVSVLPHKRNFESLELLPNNLYLVGRNPISRKKKSEDFFDYSQFPFIYREKGSSTRQTMERFIEKKKIQPVKKLELTSNEAVKQAVLAGLGYSIMPEIGIRNELSSGLLHIVPTKGLPITTSWQLIWLKGKRHTPVSNSFLEHLKLEKDSIVAEHFS
ncbi:MAG: LysR family transcriptional regulator [Flavobacteriales bacterium]|jgi:DNA-binding transcriptional LysR family regulator